MSNLLSTQEGILHGPYRPLNAEDLVSFGQTQQGLLQLMGVPLEFDELGWPTDFTDGELQSMYQNGQRELAFRRSVHEGRISPESYAELWPIFGPGL
ncbi:MAG: hypothetical protein ACI9T8_000071 [Candidatus Saccharimonadales bacterium]|jgi:hypothetical protein